MCKLCAIAVRYSRVNQDSIVFNLSQFTQVIEEKQLSQFNASIERSPREINIDDQKLKFNVDIKSGC